MYVHDFVQNGQAYGEGAETLAQVRYDPGLMRPYWDTDKQGRYRRFVDEATGRYITNEKGHKVPEVRKELAENTPCPIVNATTLRKDEWLEVDKAVLRSYRQRLRLWSDIVSRNSFGGFDGMGKMILEHETMSDPGSAQIDYDGVAEGRNDTPLFQLEGLPLPIIQSSFQLTKRRRAVSMNSGTPIDTVNIEASGRRIGETLEQLALGTLTGPTWGVAADYGRTPQVYGLTNFSDRITSVSLTTPTGSNSATTVDEVLEMRQALYDAKLYGPYMLYHSDGWDQYLDDDHYQLVTSGAAAPNTTLRRRLEAIEGIGGVRRLDYFTSDYQMVMVQMTPDVVRGVIGMPPKTIQWETKGGMQLNFKTMTIQVPQLRADYSGNCGICHATT